jgi:rod shape determining protein RodA
MLSVLVLFFNQSDSTELSYIQRSMLPFHIKRLIIGLSFFLIFSVIDYRRYVDTSFLFYIVGCVMLIAVFGYESLQGVSRWIRIPIVHLTYQPSEMMKWVLIITLAAVIHRFHGQLSRSMTVMLLVLIIIPVLMIMKQPDLGSAIIVAAIGLGILIPFLEISKRLVGVFFAIVTLFGVMIAVPSDYTHAIKEKIIGSMFHDYQRQRFRLDTYHHKMAFEAMQNGGVWGINGVDSYAHSGRLPEPYTDSIIASYIECFGLVGLFVLFGLYTSLFAVIRHTARQTKDLFGLNICHGVGIYLMVHCVVNISMMIGFFPITGVPLPLMSFGGSATISAFTCFGMLHSVYLKNRLKQH